MDFETAFAIALAAAIAYMMYVNGVEGFPPVHRYPPRIGEWGNVNNGGPPHVGGYGKETGPRSITAPNANYVKDLQKRWKAFAEHKNVQDCGIQPVMGKDCHVLKHQRTRIFISFDSESGESFTGYQLTKRQSQNHDKTGIIGKNYKN